MGGDNLIFSEKMQYELCNRRIRVALLVPVVAILAGAILRYWHIGTKSLWLDEAVTFFVASKAIPDLIKQVVDTEAHPPLFFVLLHPFLSLGRSEAVLRFLPAFFSCLSLPLIYLTAREIESSRDMNKGGERTKNNRVTGCINKGLAGIKNMSFLCLLLFAVSAFQVFFAQEARLYSLFTFLSLACFYLFIKIIQAPEKQARWPWVMYGVVCLLGLYTHLYFFFIILAANLSFFLQGKPFRNRFFSRWMGVHFLILFFFLPWLPVIWQRVQLLGGGHNKAVLSAVSSVTPLTLILAFYQINVGFGVVTWSLLIIISVIYFTFWVMGVLPPDLVNKSSLKKFFQSGRKYFQTVIGITTVFFLLPLLCVIFFPAKLHLFEAKHLLFITPFYYLIIASGLARIRNRRIIFSVVVFMLSFNLAHLSVYFSDYFIKEDWRGVSGYVQNNSLKTDIICFNPGYIGFAFDYYYQGKVPRLDITKLRIDKPTASTELSITLSKDKKNFSVWGSKEKSYRSGRIWLIEDYSTVSKPDPGPGKWFSENMQLLEEKTYPGKLGVIKVKLYRL